MPIRIADYPELKLIAWSRKNDDLIEEEEALALYERHWHYLDPARITEKERQLLDHLVARYGNGILHV